MNEGVVKLALFAKCYFSSNVNTAKITALNIYSTAYLYEYDDYRLKIDLGLK